MKKNNYVIIATIFCITTILVTVCANAKPNNSIESNMVNPIHPRLTSITIDPEDVTGQTTNAPGAWTTNLGDPLTQVGVKSDGVFLNQKTKSITLGEIDIQLEPGLNTFELVGNGIFPANTHYGAVLFLDSVATPPQIAVYNENGGSGEFMVQAKDTDIMGGANGGLFFDKAPGTNVFVTEDGTLVEVVSFVINAASSTTDEVSGYAIGSDGTNDMTATLVLRVTLETNVAVENLIDEITSMNLPNGIQNSLTSKLQNALDSLNAPNADQRNDAVNKLNAAINSIEAQAGKKISIEQADYLIAEIQKIIDSIQ